MILKFKTNGGAEENYQFIDGVSDLIVNKGKKSDFNYGGDDRADCWWEDGSAQTSDSVYMELNWADKSGTHKCYITHLPTYLLNDHGKTIERLM